MDTLREERLEQFTLMMVNIPLGFMGQVMGLVQYDWKNECTYNFLMWQQTYDNFSLHTILYANPSREEYRLQDFPVPPPQTPAGFGRGVQFMIVFNH